MVSESRKLPGSKSVLDGLIGSVAKLSEPFPVGLIGSVAKLPEPFPVGLIGPVAKLPEPFLGGLIGPVAKLSESVLDNLIGPVAKLPEPVLDGLIGPTAQLSESYLAGPTLPLVPALRELEHGGLTERLFNLAEVPRSPTPRDDDCETDASLEYKLGKLKPAYATQFRGAMLRSEERGPDWLTQTAASLRKVLLGVLHRAAPDDLVLPWVTERKTQVDVHGHPTRRTKIAWLCRSIRHEGYRKFVRSELDSALAALDLLNEAIHVDEFPDLEESFTSVSSRVRSAIRHITRLLEQRLVL